MHRPLLPAVLFAAALSATSLSTQAQTAVDTPVAPNVIDVSIGGIGPGVDAKAFARVKLAIGLAVADGTLSYFGVSGYGKEGGFSACVEKGRFAADGSFERLIKTLKAIRPNPATSFYSVTPSAGHCAYPVAPEAL
ncbi:MAG: hypothetical protein RI907_1252 [Pseudomonadota bacterium]|jgi:hypothetical protein